MSQDAARDAARDAAERAWLAAGKQGDVAAMRRLQAQHPQWLALQREVSRESKRVEASPRSPSSYCDWEHFHLPTVGASALHAAAWEGHAPLLEFLLASGQPPDARDDRGASVLVVTLMRHSVQALRAVFLGQNTVPLSAVVDRRDEDARRLERTTAICELLVRHGADVNAATEDGKTALHFAANDELHTIAALLLDVGATVDSPDDDGQTPLHYAVESQSLLATRELLMRGARVDLPDRRGATPLSLVVVKRDGPALEMMLQVVRNPAALAGTALLLSAAAGASDLVAHLVRGRHTSPTFQNARGETAMHVAIVQHHADIVRLLVELDPRCAGAGAARTVHGESALHYAARYGELRVLQLLLDQPGADQQVNTVSTDGHTPLLLATTATSGSPQERHAKAALLIQRGARLFDSPNSVLRRSCAGVSLSPGVRRCLGQWLLEATESDDSALETLCVAWAASLAPSVRAKALLVLLCAGFAADAIPLLRECRLDTQAVPGFLSELATLAAAQHHELLALLHAELAAAWAVAR